jgi:hypothetical protein
MAKAKLTAMVPFSLIGKGNFSIVPTKNNIPLQKIG